MDKLGDKVFTGKIKLTPEQVANLKEMATPKEDKRLKVLWYSDSPTVTTGFGMVARNLLKRLQATGRYDFTIVGINHRGYYNQAEYPYEIHPASLNGHVYGEDVFVKLLQSRKWDIVFTFNDFFLHNLAEDIIKEERAKQGFKWVVYVPVDNYYIHKIRNGVSCLFSADVPVVYTKWSYDNLVNEYPELKDKLHYIYHGTDIDVFHPINVKERNDFRAKLFNINPDTFLVTNVNRNQFRKDFYSTMLAFKKFHNTVPNSLLYMHAKPVDVGGNLLEMAHYVGLPKRSYVFPKDLDTNNGLPVEAINYIYNASDLVISTTIGEGWGLSVTEAMAVGVPVLFPRNTSLVEIIGENEERGFLASTGDWRVPYGFTNYPMPYVNVDSMANKMYDIYRMSRNRRGIDTINKKLLNAKKFTVDYSWDNVAKEWDKLIGGNNG